MPRRILAWECRYCGAIKKSETICNRHEITCLSNPDARNCIVCKHSHTPAPVGPLKCRKGKICSRATSAKCEHFERRGD